MSTEPSAPIPGTEPTSDGGSWAKPVLIALGVFLVVIAVAAGLIVFGSQDKLPFDYAGFDGSRK
jgi:hypothetical protein